MRAPHSRILAPSLLGVMLSGCTIHPLPEDVTKLNTFQIVKQIRCETRAAGKKLILDQVGTSYKEKTTSHSGFEISRLRY